MRIISVHMFDSDLFIRLGLMIYAQNLKIRAPLHSTCGVILPCNKLTSVGGQRQSIAPSLRGFWPDNADKIFNVALWAYCYYNSWRVFLSKAFHIKSWYVITHKWHTLDEVLVLHWKPVWGVIPPTHISNTRKSGPLATKPGARYRIWPTMALNHSATGMCDYIYYL